MFKGYIYFLHNGDFQPRYIGMTSKTPEQRLARHMSDSKRGYVRPVYNWMRKHGAENIQVCSMAETDSLEHLWELEKFYIAQERAYGSILNCTDGGEGTPGLKLTKPRQPHTEERKKNLAEKMRGNQHGAGYKHTEDAKARMSAAHKGRPSNAPVGYGLHVRWHENRSLVKTDCNFCKESN